MGSSRTILIIEDDATVRLGLKIALEKTGHGIIEAETCEDGWKLFEEHRPDLIVLDVNLPDGSGVDTCRRIRGSTEAPQTPVIMLTGKRDMDSKAEGFSAGVDQYLTKPIHVDEFLLWVEALLKRAPL